MKTISLSKISLLLVICFVLVIRLQATNITWTGIHSDEWNHFENWSPMIVPNNNDDVLIPASYNDDITINGANASCKTITYLGSGFNLKIEAGWDFILAGDLLVAGNSKIYGLGGIEITGSANCSLNYSDSTILQVNHINIKSTANVDLVRSLDMPYGRIDIFSGNLKTNGNDVITNSITIEDGTLNRSLDITNSTVDITALTLNVLNGGAFYAANSVVNNRQLISTNGEVSFNVVNSSKKTSIITTSNNAHITITELNAAGDINILGGSNFQSQLFSIVTFNILTSPSIIKFSPEPYVLSYSFYIINTPTNCQGDVLFTDGAEVRYNQVPFNIVGAANLSRASLANIKVVSGSMVVNEGTDIGNNSGVVFNQQTPNTYYWINGAGNWNDVNHWSFTSGGSTSGCMPGLKDHVIFNNASGFGANDTISVSHHIFCNNLYADPTLVNKPVISSTGLMQSINILGSVDLRGFQNFNLPFPIYFQNKTSATIQTGSHQLLEDVFFTNMGTYELLGNINCFDGLKNIYHLLGGFKTHGYEVKVSSFISKGLKLAGSSRSLSLYNSTLNIGHPVLSPGCVIVNSDSLNLNAGTSNFIFTYLQNLAGQFKIEGNTNLNFYNLQYLNQNGTPFLIFNLQSSFNKVHFKGNGQLLNANNSINSEMSAIDTLIITGKYRYELEENTMVDIRKKIIHQHGVCNEISIIASTSLANRAHIYSSGTSALVFENTWIENIEANGNNIPFNVTNGVDGGNNNNFNFLSINPPQIFYWNGEAATSNWSDGNNWNIGVLPHAGNSNDIFLYNTNVCIPGYNDSVVFNANSFPIIDTVTINENANYKGMMWVSGSGNNRLVVGSNQFTMNNYGGLALDNNLNMVFDGESIFRSPYTRQLHFKQVTIPGMLTFYNLGKYILMDDLICDGYAIQLLAGSFKTNNHSIKANRFWIKHEYAPSFHNNTVDFGSSTLQLANNFLCNLYSQVSQLNAENSLINLTGYVSNMAVTGNLEIIQFGHVNYTASNGNVGLSSFYYYGNGIPAFKHVNFEPSGYILGNNSIDTLVLAEGKDYELESNSTQYINNLLYSKGSPCLRTTITSTIPGTRAFIQNQNCHLLVEHARIRDIEGVMGTCSANNYLVGVGGEDLGNNLNWYFIPGNPVNGFGNDTTLTCNSLPYTQTSLGFGRYESIVWSTGSTNSQMLINSASAISAVITYSPTCIIEDSRIFYFENEIDQSGTVKDITCFGSDNGSIQLHIQDVDTNYLQTWIYPNNQTHQRSSQLNGLTTGTYTSIVSIPGYEAMCSDTATFTILEPTQLTVQLDTTIAGKCSDPDGIILITSAGGSGEHTYQWNDESTSEDNYTAAAGWNQLVVADTNGCTAQLSVELACVEHINIPELITPNGDGYGDNWEIIDLYRLYPNNDVKIMNRWGNVVYHKKGYSDQFTGIPNTGDTFSIGYLSSGTYFYVIDLGTKYKTLTGYVEIIY